MKLHFGKIEIYNFLSFEREEFDFSLHKGMNLICGYNNDVKGYKLSNGSGKTSIASALTFALFGKPLHNIKNERIPNRYLPKSEPCIVTLYFKADNISYKIESGLSPKYRGHYCHIYKIIDNEEIELTKSTVLETHKYIETEIIKCDMSIFLRTIVMTSDQTYNFFKLRAYQKKEFIEHIFDLSVFGNIYSLIHKDLINLEKEVFSKQKELLTISSSLKEYESLSENHIKDINEKCKKIQNDINENEDILSKINTSHPDNSNKIKSLNQKNVELKSRLNELNIKINEYQNKQKKYDNELHKLNTIKNEKNKILISHKKTFDEICESCKPIFDKNYSITKSILLINSIDENINKINVVIDKLETNQNILHSKIININKTLQKIELYLNKLNSMHLENQLKLSKIKNRIESYNETLDDIKNQKNPYESLIISAKDNFEKEQTALYELSDNFNYLKYAENIVSQDTLRKFIIKDLISLLNVQINSYLSRIGTEYSCKFDEDLNFVFYTDGGEAEYDNFSSGEKMRLSIATSFAFRDFMATRSNIISNILILDEYIDSNLDTAAINELIKILREFIVLYNQGVYLVSHRKEIDNSIFNNIIVVEKTNKISKISYDIINNVKNNER